MKRLLLIMLSTFVLFTGCSAKTNSSKASLETTAATTSGPVSETAADPALVLPTVENTSGKVQIQTVNGNRTTLLLDF